MMKVAMRAVALSAVGAVVVYAAVGPGVGVFYHTPMAAIGTGLIGLGLTVDAIRLRKDSIQGGKSKRGMVESRTPPMSR